jgi:hypothetical protein
VAEGKVNPNASRFLKSEFSVSEAAELDRRIVLALETAPRLAIPAGFAARVMAQLPTRRTVAVTPARYGYRMGAACLFLVLALMVAFAHQGTSVFGASLEWTLFLQFAVVAIWLVARSAGYTLTSIF